ncbi:hypothetical protein LMH87_001007 [Akanthomyces muscarius]|uniref:Uncharacterized protein n=1 Tax=Akanthomyces muscarius TaxID=2231603 RepID=A0A9W8ULM7_AKAMU|nr:hypothetical protein LMH87_001007 [Akanthomyces muscarius]KAJ4155778.1 hypothetical protein LMH87_001007 [Akanthomyces muscarius]
MSSSNRYVSVTSFVSIRFARLFQPTLWPPSNSKTDVFICFAISGWQSRTASSCRLYFSYGQGSIRLDTSISPALPEDAPIPAGGSCFAETKASFFVHVPKLHKSGR